MKANTMTTNHEVASGCRVQHLGGTGYTKLEIDKGALSSLRWMVFDGLRQQTPVCRQCRHSFQMECSSEWTIDHKNEFIYKGFSYK